MYDAVHHAESSKVSSLLQSVPVKVCNGTTINVLSKNNKKYHFLMKFSIFTAEKISVYCMGKYNEIFVTSKFYPSRRSSKMIAKNEPLELISEDALHLPTKFGEDRPKNLGEVGEQTKKKKKKKKKKNKKKT